jgi:tight adherence protein C
VSKKNSHIKSLREGAELIDYMILSLESGSNIQSAFFQASQNLNSCEIKENCNKIQTLCLLGMSFRQAIQRSLTENENTVFKEILENIDISLQFGSPIMQILNYLSMHLRCTALARFEELAAQAPIKMIFPLVIFIFPVIFILLGAGALKDLMDSLNF